MNTIMMRTITVLSLCTSMLLASAAQATETTYRKSNDSSIFLMISTNGSAEISQYVGGKKTVLIEGKVESTMPSSLTLVRPEGDVCPNVQIELYHDIVYGEDYVAQVRNKYE